MAEFLYLFRAAAPAREPSPDEMQRSMQKWGAWMQELTKAGKLKAGLPLERGGRVLSGPRRLVTDGPYAESKEIVGGYLIVTARDLTEATELAKGCPIFEDGGSVEVRQLMQMPS